MMRTILTIGHSTLDYAAFLDLLRSAGVDAVADVRTSPYSRFLPQFNREELKAALAADGLAYAFLGKELGGRPSGRAFYCDGVADYERMAQTDTFRTGLERVVKGAETFKLALMCSEQDPLDCHRCLLVGRSLAATGHHVRHILHDGEQETQTQIEARLLTLGGFEHNDLFASPADRLALAYRARARKVAFDEPVAAAE